VALLRDNVPDLKINFELFKNNINNFLSIFFKKLGKITQTVTQKNTLT
jgi:hypothetical protein